MKNREQKVKVKVKPKRVTAREQRQAKRAAKASEQLALFRQSAEFHKAYLNAELEAEAAKYEAIQARLAALQPETETTVITEEEVAEVETFEEAEDIFDVEAVEEEAPETIDM